MRASSMRRSGLRFAFIGIVLLAAPVFAAPVADDPQQPKAKTAVDRAGATANVQAPIYREYRGVMLGMTADEVRAKLGSPSTSDATSDTFMKSDKELATVYYDAGKNVIAVVTTYTGSDSGAPDALAVFGSDVTPGEGGSISEMVRYENDGYWVSYNRIPGDDPVTIVTIRKIPNHGN